MPSRAARWISWIAFLSNVADSRRPGCQPAWWYRRFVIVSNSVMRGPPWRSVLAGVVDVEVVEAPRRAVAAEVRRLDVVDPGALEQRAQLGEVVVAQLLLDAVGAEGLDAPAHVEVRLVDRVAERVAGVAADDEAAPLGHERAHVADRAADDDVDALHRDAAARRGVAVDDHEAAAAGGGSRLARVALDDHGPGHDVLGDPDARVAVHADRRLLVHARAVVADVPVDLDRDRRVEPDRQRVRAARVHDAPVARLCVGASSERVKARVELAARGGGEVERLDGHVGLDRHQTRSRSQTYTFAGSGSQTVASAAPGSTAIARYSEAIATQSSVSAITAGLHAIGSRRTAKPSAVPTRNV